MPIPPDGRAGDGVIRPLLKADDPAAAHDNQARLFAAWRSAFQYGGEVELAPGRYYVAPSDVPDRYEIGDDVCISGPAGPLIELFSKARAGPAVAAVRPEHVVDGAAGAPGPPGPDRPET